MKLQPVFRKEIRRIAAGTGVCTLVLTLLIFLLSRFGIGIFDRTVLIGATGGFAVAVANFAVLCLTIQRAAASQSSEGMQALLRGSYHVRLLLQAAWVLAAFLIPQIHVLAAAIPLLFPAIVIFFLRKRQT